MLLLAAFLVTPALAQRSPLTAADPNAATLLRQAAEAVGRPDSTGAVRSLVLSGQITITPVADLPRPRDLEIRFLLPDRYLRIVRDDATTEYSGFAADALLSRLEVRDRGRRTSAGYPSKQMPLERAAFARLLLGLLATASSAFPLTASTPPSPEECPGGPCLKIAGPDRFSCALDLAADTHLPSALRYEASIRMPPATPVALTRSGQGRLPAPERVAVTMRFDEWRRQGSVMLPRCIVTKARNVVLDEMVISSFVVNAPLAEQDFRCKK